MRSWIMRLFGAALLLTGWLVVTPGWVAACTGGDAPLATGIRGASAIFYARIVSETVSSVGSYTLDLSVGTVVRGEPHSHVQHLITPRACDQLLVGDSGIVVLGSVNPYGVGPKDIYNFFYVLGPGHTSAAEARALFYGLPATDTISAIVGRASAPASLFVPLLAGLVAAAAVLAVRSRGRAESPSQLCTHADSKSDRSRMRN